MINLEQTINDFKVTLLWSNEIDDLTIYDIDDQSSEMINDLVTGFIATLTSDQLLALEEEQEEDQIGHWLALEMGGHGAGFFDSANPTIKIISYNVEEFNHFIGEVYQDSEAQQVYISFFSYGK